MPASQPRYAGTWAVLRVVLPTGRLADSQVRPLATATSLAQTAPMRFLLPCSVLIFALACTKRSGEDPEEDRRGEGEGEGVEGEGEEGEGEGQPSEGEGEGEGEGDPGEGEGEGEGDPLVAALRALRAEAGPRTRIEEQLKACVTAAAAATGLSGSGTLITHGTVDLRASDGSYTASPADRLVVLDSDAATYIYTVTTMDIDVDVSSIDEVLVREHQLQCRAQQTGAFDLQLHSALVGDSGARSASGSVQLEGGSHQIDWQASRSTVGGPDGDLWRYDTTDTRTLEVTGPSLVVHSEETETHVLLLSDELFENLNTALSVSATVDGTAVAMADGLIRRSFRNGSADEDDFWGQTHGSVAVDGAAFGELAFRMDPVGPTWQIVLDAGTSVEVLEEYP